MESILTQEELEAIYSAMQSGGDVAAVDDLVLTHGKGYSRRIQECWMTASKAMNPWVEGFISAVMGIRAVIRRPEIRIIGDMDSERQHHSVSVQKMISLNAHLFLVGMEFELARRFVDRRAGAEIENDDTDDERRELTILETHLMGEIFEGLAARMADACPMDCRGVVLTADPEEFPDRMSKRTLVELRMYADAHPGIGIWMVGPAEAFVPMDENIRSQLSSRVHRATVQLPAVLGRTQLTVTDLWNLTAGSLITLDAAVGDPVQVLIGNRYKLSGDPLVSRSNLAVKLSGTGKNGAVR